IPGERVVVELTARKGVLLGAVTDVLEPSPARVTGPAHPGLDYGHIDYARQLTLKREVVSDAIRRALRRDVAVAAVRASPSQLGYRNTVQPAVRAGGLGYRRLETDDVVVLDADPTAFDSVNRAWQAVLAVGAQRLAGLQ